MFAWIDSLWWMDALACLALGVWIGRRWALVKMQAECRARNCQTIKDMRTEKMKLAADKMTLEHRNEFMREVVAAKTQAIHSLKTSNGIMAREIQNLTDHIPRQKRRMVA